MTIGSPALAGAHICQFYENEAWRSAAIIDFFGGALRDGAPTVMIARPCTFDAVIEDLAGRDAAVLDAARRMLFLDADAVLAEFMVEGLPDPVRLDRVVANLLAEVFRNRAVGPLWIYAETSDILCRRGQPAGAVALEELWNRRYAQPSIALMCGYSIGSFDSDAPAAHFRSICQAHTHVVPAEGFTDAIDERARLEQVAWLQHRARTQRAAVSETPAPAPVTTSPVYVIDDDESMRRSLVRLLESFDVSVQAFPSAEAFLADVERTANGCVLLDIQLEGMSGIDLLSLMTAENWRTPVIAMSGLHDDRMEADALREGARAFLRKPFDADQLFDAIRRAQR